MLAPMERKRQDRCAPPHHPVSSPRPRASAGIDSVYQHLVMGGGGNENYRELKPVQVRLLRRLTPLAGLASADGPEGGENEASTLKPRATVFCSSRQTFRFNIVGYRNSELDMVGAVSRSGGWRSLSFLFAPTLFRPNAFRRFRLL